MQYVGIDIIEIQRIQAAINVWGNRFLERIYTENELALFKPVPSLAARFAGKEAVIKVLDASDWRVGWREIEILSHHSGQPFIKLYGRALERSRQLNIPELVISISHSREFAVAMVLGESKDNIDRNTG